MGAILVDLNTRGGGAPPGGVGGGPEKGYSMGSLFLSASLWMILPVPDPLRLTSFPGELWNNSIFCQGR